MLAGDHFLMTHHRLARSGIDHDISGILEKLGDDGGDDLLALLLVFLHYIGTLRLTDALNDDLLCGLRRQASEILRLDLGLHDVTDGISLRYLSRIVERDLGQRIRDLFDYRLPGVNLNILFLGIESDAHVVSSALSLVGGAKSRLDPLKHIFLRNTLGFLKGVKGVKEFGIHPVSPVAIYNGYKSFLS